MSIFDTSYRINRGILCINYRGSSLHTLIKRVTMPIQFSYTCMWQYHDTHMNIKWECFYIHNAVNRHVCVSSASCNEKQYESLRN